MKDAAEDFTRATRLYAVGGVAAMVALWLACFVYLPAPADMSDRWARLGFAAGWLAVAALFGLTAAVEAGAHERLQTNAFDPLAGHETRRLRVNLRYLQNTLEQTVLFGIGIIGLALTDSASPESSARAITACSIVWIVARYLFWIGYHRSSGVRVIGIAGLAQSLLVLLWLSARFGQAHFGLPGLIAPLIAFGLIEFALVRSTRDTSRP